MKRVILYTDGASRGNPGPAAAGAVIFGDDGEVLKEISKPLGTQTNNFAEYTALIEGLKACHELGFKQVHVRADSEFMIKQMKGEYKVKAPGIIPLFEEAKKLLPFFSKISFEHIPREKNEHADSLANRALDQK